MSPKREPIGRYGLGLECKYVRNRGLKLAGMSAIEVSSLEKSYGQLKAVDGISFSVRKGEVFSLLGPNGAGKTTTIEILEGLRQRHGGQVSVLAADPGKKGYELHRKLGIIPQGFTF